MSGHRSTVHLVLGFPVHFSLSAACGKLLSSSSVVTSNSAAGPGGLLRWELLQSPPSAPGPAVSGTGSVPYLCPLKIVEIWVFCSCALVESVSPQNTLSFTTKF